MRALNGVWFPALFAFSVRPSISRFTEAARLAAEMMGLAFSFAVRALEWSLSRIAQSATTVVSDGLIPIASRAKQAGTSLVSLVFRVAGVRQFASAVGHSHPYNMIGFQVALLAIAIVFFAYSRGIRLAGVGSRPRARSVLIGLVCVVAILSVGLVQLGYPPRKVVEDVSSASNLTGRLMRPTSASPDRVEVAVPRRARVLVGKVTLNSTVTRPLSPLLSVTDTTGDRGFLVSADHFAAHGLELNRTYAIGGLEVLVGAVANPGMDLTLSAYRDEAGRPGGDPLFRATAAPGDLGLAPRWLSFKLSSPFLLFGGSRIWIVLSSGAPSSYIWFASNATGGHSLVFAAGKGWSSVKESPCVTVAGEHEYLGPFSIDVGRTNNYFSGEIPIGGSCTIDIADPLADYVRLSPENFKMIQVPLKVSSATRSELVIARMELVVEEPNPVLIHARVSLMLSVIVGVLCLYSVWRLLTVSLALPGRVFSGF